MENVNFAMLDMILDHYCTPPAHINPDSVTVDNVDSLLAAWTRFQMEVIPFLRYFTESAALIIQETDRCKAILDREDAVMALMKACDDKACPARSYVDRAKLRHDQMFAMREKYSPSALNVVHGRARTNVMTLKDLKVSLEEGAKLSAKKSAKLEELAATLTEDELDQVRALKKRKVDSEAE